MYTEYKKLPDKFSKVYKKLLHERVVDVLERAFSAREVEVFEGVLELEKPVPHCYVLIRPALYAY